MTNPPRRFRPQGPSLHEIFRYCVETAQQVHQEEPSGDHQFYEYTARVFRWYADSISSEVENHEADLRIVDFWPDPKALNESLRVNLAAVFHDHRWSGMARKLDPKTWKAILHAKDINKGGRGGVARIKVLLDLLRRELLLALTFEDTKLDKDQITQLIDLIRNAEVKMASNPEKKAGLRFQKAIRTTSAPPKEEPPPDQAPKEEPPQPFRRHPKR